MRVYLNGELDAFDPTRMLALSGNLEEGMVQGDLRGLVDVRIR